MSRQYDDLSRQRVFAYIENAIKNLPDYCLKAKQTVYVSRTVYGSPDKEEFVYKFDCDSRAEAIVAMHTYVPKYDKNSKHIVHEKNVGKMYLKPELYERFVHTRPAIGLLKPDRRY